MPAIIFWCNDLTAKIKSLSVTNVQINISYESHMLIKNVFCEIRDTQLQSVLICI